jgi:DNA repair exonuclease SbcCD ATPase subunit
MSKDKIFDPFEGFKQISEMWEKQLNGLLYMMTDNKEFVRTAKVGLEAHSRYMELLRKNQELLAGLMNIPTKSDVANVAKLSVQAEEKIDALEEQIWNLQDSVNSLNKENVEVFQEMVKVVQQIKIEFQKAAQELSETKGIKSDLQELRQGIVEIRIMQINLQELRKELEDMKDSQVKMGTNDSTEAKITQSEFMELRHELSQLSDIKKDIASLKNMMKKEKEKDKVKEKELVLTGNGTTKG